MAAKWSSSAVETEGGGCDSCNFSSTAKFAGYICFGGAAASNTIGTIQILTKAFPRQYDAPCIWSF